ncbi:S-layer domain protein [Alkaliphilus metalliredigens QYMF]|uniref:S-layer domain protein n=1 Tax=Alkaliphilus metalliredigens (strain QYMF) TaxID=293826 RepID=A6TVN4_ALKMQ|nr:S-layer homology domain-containing protein [Alkaliphilus metalliredigens]ABR50252.1 S-layer domain protein [Alkaliphilus metalliredigens QYMF]
MFVKNQRSKKSKTFLVLTIVLSLLATNMKITTVHAYNNFWSGEAIADFIHNKVDVSILDDNKYTENITREELAELIISMYAIGTQTNKEDIPLKENPFKDTDSIDVQRAYSLGLIKGISKDEYAPMSNITREELAIVIAKFLNINGIDTDVSGNLNNFSDEKDISKWAYNAMLYCVNEGIIKGFNNRLDPKLPTTIEQALIILDKIALRYEWFTPSKDSYYDGFFVPRDTELNIFVRGDVSPLIEWGEIKSREKLENDLYYMLNSKLEDTVQINDLIKIIINTESYYSSGNTQDFIKFFEIDGTTFRVISSYDSSETWVNINSFQ